MTVVAWDGKTLAADKRGDAGGSIYITRKIWRITDCLVGFVGSGDRVGALRTWIEQGWHVSDYPAMPPGDTCFMLVIRPDGRIERYEDTPWPQIIEAEFYAMGSGSDCARAAMHLGHDAAESVAIASLFDTGCGNGCDMLTFDDP